MKKNLLYLLAFVSVIFASCDPLDKTYDEIESTYKKDVTLTITTNYPTVDAANTGIAGTLNNNYSHLGEGSRAYVTYNSSLTTIKPADSLLANIAYTVTDADYAFINGNQFKNFNSAKFMQFLNTKYPTPVENQLAVISYVYFQSGVTTSAGAPVTETYIYMKGQWMKVYHVSQAQYISAGKLTVFNFGSADEANLNGYFNTFLKSDASVAASAKVGDIKYVSYTYFASNKTYQRIKPLVFDGTNWTSKSIPATPLTFLKKGGTWIPDPTLYYTLVRADYNTIGGSTAGTAAGRANLAQFGSFDVSGGPNNWTLAQINEGLIVILNAKYGSAPADDTVFYNVTYALFRGAEPTGTTRFVKTANGFEVVAP